MDFSKFVSSIRDGIESIRMSQKFSVSDIRVALGHVRMALATYSNGLYHIRMSPVLIVSNIRIAIVHIRIAQ